MLFPAALVLAWACCVPLQIASGQRYAERNVPPAPSPDTAVSEYDEDYYKEEDLYGFEEKAADVYKWKAEEFPHPINTPRFCNRLKASHVCDPDLVLEREQADLLDASIQQLYRGTPCICDACKKEDGGVVVGIALFKRMQLPYHVHHSRVIKQFAETLRFRWNLGSCDNDILIVVATDDRMSYTDVGGTTSNYLSIHEAHRIFLENKAQFSAGNFSQGLADILQGYHMATLGMQKGSANDRSGLDLSAITGIIVGSVLIIGLLLFVGFVIYRRRKGRGKDTVDAKTDTKTASSTISSSWSKKDIKVLFSSDKSRNPPLSSARYQKCGTDEIRDAEASPKDEVLDFTLASAPDDASFEQTRLTELTSESEALEQDLATAAEGVAQTFPSRNEQNVLMTNV